jgi:2-oxoglutarate dehydrogenase E2 component (dihydrolipoamide succinyltransferase)
MKTEIKIPAMGESISEATIGAFIKANGSFVKVDDELLELETDKVNQILYAPQAGVVTWNVAEGDTVKIGQVIGSVDGSKEAPAQEATSQPPPKAAPKEVKAETKEEVPFPTKQKAPAETDATKDKSAKASGARSGKEQFLAGLEQDESEKIKAFQPTSTHAPPQSSQPSRPSERSETRQKMTRIRKVIASRLVDVLQQTAMLTTFNEVDMTKIMEMREAYKEPFTKKYQVKLGFMPFFVKAAVSAMKAFPEINAYIDGDELVYRNYFDIGIAVGTDKGLFVPVVRECDTLSFADIEHSIESFARKAREGGLAPGDLQGGGFTITNGGTYGSLLSTPILNPPQSAILGMHKIMKRPVVVDDQIVIRQMMYLALSYDHRVVDGKEAVSFLVHIKNALEDPSRILIGI